MTRGWKLTRLAGIDVSVHWSFLLLLAWIVSAALGSGAGLLAALGQVGFVLAAFACVVLHELGHALAARWFGVHTHQITLLPIGGVAHLDRIPRNPWQELVIALAGPAVNVVIAILLTPIVVGTFGLSSITASAVLGGDFIIRLLVFNFVMIAFNMLPAFPMDGGRVLRALLALRSPYLRATEWAVRVGQIMAIVFVVAAPFTNPFLLFIALFVYLAGKGELTQLKSELSTPFPGTIIDGFARPSSAPVPAEVVWGNSQGGPTETIVLQRSSPREPYQVIILAEEV